MKELNFDSFTFVGAAREMDLDYFFSEDEVLDAPEYGVVIDTNEGNLDLLDDADFYSVSVIEDIEIPILGETPELVAVPVRAEIETATGVAYPRARGRKSRRKLREAAKKIRFQEVIHGKFGRPVGVR